MACENHKIRRSIRLDDFDYAQPGAYFITICAHSHRRIFGSIADEMVRLNWIGGIVREEWWKTEVLRPEVMLDQFIAMPNHFHAIIHLIKPPPIHI